MPLLEVARRRMPMLEGARRGMPLLDVRVGGCRGVVLAQVLQLSSKVCHLLLHGLIGTLVWGRRCPTRVPLGNNASICVPCPSSPTIAPWVEFDSRVVVSAAIATMAASATVDVLLRFAQGVLPATTETLKISLLGAITMLLLHRSLRTTLTIVATNKIVESGGL